MGNPFLPDEPMPDVPAERRLPPKKMKLLEERNGGVASGSPVQQKQNDNAVLKYHFSRLSRLFL